MATAMDSREETGVADDSPKGGSQVARARARKANAALELKRKNYSWEKIAETLGFPTGRAAMVATERVLEEGLLSPESQEFMRQLAGDRLEEMIFALREDALKRGPDQIAAIAKTRDLIETHMRLFGYAAPAQVAFYNPLESEVTEFIAATLKQRDSGKRLEESDIFEMAPGEDGVYEITAADNEADIPVDIPAPETEKPQVNEVDWRDF